MAFQISDSVGSRTRLPFSKEEMIGSKSSSRPDKSIWEDEKMELKWSTKCKPMSVRFSNLIQEIELYLRWTTVEAWKNLVLRSRQVSQSSRDLNFQRISSRLSFSCKATCKFSYFERVSGLGAFFWTSSKAERMDLMLDWILPKRLMFRHFKAILVIISFWFRTLPSVPPTQEFQAFAIPKKLEGSLIQKLSNWKA